MKKSNSNIHRILILLAILPFVISSCVTQKQIKYLQKAQKYDTTSNYDIKQAADYKIQPNDNLYIHVYSMDKETNQLFTRMAGSSNSSSNYYSDQGIYFEGYTVSNDGNVDFPIIGKVYVKELTIEQARALFQQLVDEYLKETVVVVKIAQFNITILGEVRNPQTFKVFQDKINLFEAFSKVGDITDFGNRKRVALIRQVKNQSKVQYLDLTSDKILTSDFYYLAPNDILYVAPLKVKQYGFSSFPYALIFSSITTIISLLTFIKVY